MKKYLFYSILIFIIAIAISIALDTDEVDWLRARLCNKSTDYAQYIKAHPDGWHIFEAQRRYDRRSWEEALQIGTLAHFQNYLKNNPQGLYVDAANEKIQDLSWKLAREKNSITAYQNYINKYPDSKYLKNAETNIEELHWQEVTYTNKLEGYREYIELYPAGNYVEAAENEIETLVWENALEQNKIVNYQEYIDLYPNGIYVTIAKEYIEELQQQEPWPVYIDSYHLYELTDFDTDFGYMFENHIKEVISKFDRIKIVPERSDAVVHLQIGYALSFRDGKNVDDNISKYIKNKLRDRVIVKQELSMPTYDLGLHIYLWDIENDCLIGFSNSATPPETGNAIVSRIVGRDTLLNEQLAAHTEHSLIGSLNYLERGLDGVMYINGDPAVGYYRPDVGKPKKRICIEFHNGPIQIYHWRDSTIESYIYYQFRQSNWDCVKTFNDQSYKLDVVWSKFDRGLRVSTEIRAYSLMASFLLYDKRRENKNVHVLYQRDITSAYQGSYALHPVDVINEWRNVFNSSYIVGKIISVLEKLIEKENQQ